jgi:hypothetical protein
MAGIVVGRQDPWPPFAPLPETVAAPSSGGFQQFPAVFGNQPPVQPVDAHALLMDHLARLWGLMRHADGTADAGLGGTR